MSNHPSPPPPCNAKLDLDAVRARLKKRSAAARRFRRLCQLAVGCALAFLVLLLGTLIARGYSGFFQTFLEVEIYFDPDVIDPEGRRDPEVLAAANYSSLIRSALQASLPDAEGRQGRRAVGALISTGATYDLSDRVVADPTLIGQRRTFTLLASDEVDLLMKGQISREVDASARRLSDQQIAWLDELEARGQIETKISRYFFTTGDSREPELAGIWGAVAGSAYTMAITLLLSFPLGAATAI